MKLGNSLPAVVINLDRHPERLAFFMEQAARAGLDVQRMSAVDARDPGVQHLIREVRDQGSPLSDGEIACAMSHREVWHQLVRSAHPYMAVFEDDVCLAAGMADWLLPARFPAGADIIKLEAYNEKVVLASQVVAMLGQRQLRRLLSRSYGSAAYIISRACAASLLEATGSFSEPVDHMLFGEGEAFRPVANILQLVPAACIQRDCMKIAGEACQQFSSSLDHTSRHAGGWGRRESGRDLMKQGRSRVWRNVRRYFAYVVRGANPLHFRCRIAVDLTGRS